MVDHLSLILIAMASTTFLLATITFTEAATRIGAIVDETSRIGKEQTLAMQMALQDLHDYSTNKTFLLHLHIRNSSGEPLQAALSAQELVMNSQVNAIVGPSSWEETSLVAEIGSKNQIPIMSLADSTPKWARERWPFLVQFSSTKSSEQMEAIASIIQSFGWHQVSVICEDLESSTKAILQLSHALRRASGQIVDVVTLPPLSTSLSLFDELESLRIRPCRVFVVHISSSTLADRLFKKAKDMKMMERDYVWIATDVLTSLLYSIDPSTISAMQGVIGVKGHYLQISQKFQSFHKRFRRRFSLVHPDEHSYDHGIFAVEAYDAIWTLGLSLLRDSSTKGKDLLNKLLASNFSGLLGNVQFTMQKATPEVNTFEIINVIGKSYNELGFWSTGQGFSEKVSGENNATFFTSMRDITMGQVLWPGRPWYIPKGWTTSPIDEPLRIGVPTESIFKQFVDVEFDPTRKNIVSVKGYAIELFEKAVEKLPFYLPYKYLPFNGTYTALVEQIYLKNVDAAVGDIAIVTSRLPYADFTHPYTESELVMIVLLQPKKVNRAWLITKPFTTSLWLLILILNIYNGFVVWMIERDKSLEPKGSLLNEIGVMMSLSFTTLFSLQGSKLTSNLSRMTMVVWLFMALVITQTYTANLSSILTVQELETAIDCIESIQMSHSHIGYLQVTYVARYLEEVLHFNPNKVKNYTSPEASMADLQKGVIAAVFMERPWAKILLARYCTGFTIAKQSFKVGGFGFAFAKGSPWLPYMTEALVKVTESGQLRDLERDMIASQKCVGGNKEVLGSDGWDSSSSCDSIGADSFWMLFIFTAGTSTLALLMFLFWWKDDVEFYDSSSDITK
ncbi:Glutamate receptor 2.7 [Linum perenne]